MLVILWGIQVSKEDSLSSTKKTWFFYSVIPFLYSIIGSIIGGATMAVLNILVEMTRRNSIFEFGDLFTVSLWYIVVWLVFGLSIGIIHMIWRFIRKNRKPISIHKVFFICIYIAVWLFVFISLNMFFYWGYVNSASIILSSSIILIGILAFFILSKAAKKIKTTKLALLLRVYIIFLIIAILFSPFARNISFGKSERSNLAPKSKGTDRYNVILIVLDAVRFDHVSCYGSENITTPNIDGMASEGVLFENAFSASSYTLESVISLLTSCYPSKHNVKSVTSAIPRNLLTLPEIFKAFDYRTAIFSVNPYVSIAQGYDKGVDDFFGLGENAIKVNRSVLGLFLRYFPVIPVLQKMFMSVLEFSHFLFSSEASFESVNPAEINQRVMQWLGDIGGEPFFMYLHYYGGHAPYEPPEYCWRLFDPNYQGTPVIDPPRGARHFLPFVRGKPLHEEAVNNMIAHYDGEIFYHDECLGDLFDYLKRLNLIKRTIIVVTSDHGEEFYEHKGWDHGHSLYEEMIHIPLIFWCPDLIPEGKIVQELVSLVDVFPTLLSLCRTEESSRLPYAIDGVDLSPLFMNTSPKPELEYVFSELSEKNNSIRCIRTMSFKAIDIRFGFETEKMLFNLKEDPGEKTNVYDKQRHVAEVLFCKIDSIVKQSKEESFKPRGAFIDEKQIKLLRTLGYIK